MAADNDRDDDGDADHGLGLMFAEADRELEQAVGGGDGDGSGGGGGGGGGLLLAGETKTHTATVADGAQDAWMRVPTAVAAHAFSFLDMAPHLCLARCSRTLMAASRFGASAIAPVMTLVVRYPIPKRTVLRLLPSRHLTLRARHLSGIHASLGPGDALRQVTLAIRDREEKAAGEAALRVDEAILAAATGMTLPSMRPTQPTQPTPVGMLRPWGCFARWPLFSRLTIRDFSLGAMPLLTWLPSHVADLAVHCERASKYAFANRAGDVAWRSIATCGGGLCAVEYPQLPLFDDQVAPLTFPEQLTRLEIGPVVELNLVICQALASVTDLSVERFEHALHLHTVLRRLPLTRLAVRNITADAFSGSASVGTVAARTLRTLELGHLGPGDTPPRAAAHVADRLARDFATFLGAFGNLRRLSITEDVTREQLVAATVAQTRGDRGSVYWRQDLDANAFVAAHEVDDAIVTILPRHDWRVLEQLPHLETLELGHHHHIVPSPFASSSSSSSSSASLSPPLVPPPTCSLIPPRLPKLASLRELRVSDRVLLGRDAEQSDRLLDARRAASLAACFPALERFYIGGVACPFAPPPPPPLT